MRNVRSLWRRRRCRGRHEQRRVVSLTERRLAALLCLVGDPGTGKSHLLIGLGAAAAMAGFRVRYVLAAKLVNELVEAADDKISTGPFGPTMRLSPACGSSFPVSSRTSTNGCSSARPIPPAPRRSAGRRRAGRRRAAASPSECGRSRT
ncbi:ATP-binding protein [Micromonospora sp. NPDC048909]|uniref:ATP-binding protein n=1 Tax=Micromonospora sp. NPDC048909 TaxID=3155643 RepID=UPI0033F1B6B2